MSYPPKRYVLLAQLTLEKTQKVEINNRLSYSPVNYRLSSSFYSKHSQMRAI